jgi:hypothetical protein
MGDGERDAVAFQILLGLCPHRPELFRLVRTQAEAAKKLGLCHHKPNQGIFKIIFNVRSTSSSCEPRTIIL